MTGNHQYGTATRIVPDGNGTFDPGFQSTASGYDDPETAPPGITLPAGTYRALWFTYVPAASAINVEIDTIAINSTGQAISPVYLSLYSVTGGVWTVLAEQNNTGWIYYQPWSVTAGTTYYLRTASSDPTAGQIRLLAVRAPAAGTAAPAPTPVVDTSNHQYANATRVVPDGNGTFDPGFQNTATGYDNPETAPPGVTLPAGTYRALWFTYLPATSAINAEVDTIAINSTGQAISPVYLSLYSVTGGVWTVLAEQNNTGWIYYQPWSVTAGTTYYLRTASSDPTAGQIRLLTVRAPAAGTATAPPVTSTSAATDKAGAGDTAVRTLTAGSTGGGPGPGADTTNHQIANATPVIGAPFTQLLNTADAHYADVEVNTTGYDNLGNPTGRAAWYVLDPAVEGPYLVQVAPDTRSLQVQVFSVTNGSWTLRTSANVAGGQSANIGQYATVGPRYYVRIVCLDAATPYTATVTVSGTAVPAAPAGPQSLQITRTDTAGPGDTSPGPRNPNEVLTVAVAVPVGFAPARLDVGGGLVVPAGPGDAGVEVPDPVTVPGTVALIAPTGGYTVPAARPAFTVAATTGAVQAGVQIGYSTDPAFGTETLLPAVPAPAGLDAAQVSAVPDSDLTGGVWWWRARLAGPYGVGAWSPPGSFAVTTGDGAAVATGSWTVTAAAGAVPHLWFLDPGSGADTGQSAAVYGCGFGTAPQVLLGDTVCALTDATAEPGTGDPAAITPGGDTTVYHEVLTFTLPELDPDDTGDAVTVIGGA